MRLPRTSTILIIAALSFIATIAVWWCQPTEEEILKRYGLEAEGGIVCEDSHYKFADQWIEEHRDDFPEWLDDLLNSRFKNNTYELRMGNSAPISPSQYAADLDHLKLTRVTMSLPLAPEIRQAMKKQRGLISVFLMEGDKGNPEDLDFLQNQPQLEECFFLPTKNLRKEKAFVALQGIAAGQGQVMNAHG